MAIEVMLAGHEGVFLYQGRVDLLPSIEEAIEGDIYVLNSENKPYILLGGKWQILPDETIYKQLSLDIESKADRGYEYNTVTKTLADLKEGDNVGGSNWILPNPLPFGWFSGIGPQTEFLRFSDGTYLTIEVTSPSGALVPTLKYYVSPNTLILYNASTTPSLSSFSIPSDIVVVEDVKNPYTVNNDWLKAIYSDNVLDQIEITLEKLHNELNQKADVAYVDKAISGYLNPDQITQLLTNFEVLINNNLTELTQAERDLILQEVTDQINAKPNVTSNDIQLIISTILRNHLVSEDKVAEIVNEATDSFKMEIDKKADKFTAALPSLYGPGVEREINLIDAYSVLEFKKADKFIDEDRSFVKPLNEIINGDVITGFNCPIVDFSYTGENNLEYTILIGLNSSISFSGSPSGLLLSQLVINPMTKNYIYNYNNNPVSNIFTLSDPIDVYATYFERITENSTGDWAKQITAIGYSSNAVTNLADVSNKVTHHIDTDNDRWINVNKTIVNLRAELKAYAQELYEGTTPVYDYTQTQTVISAGGLVSLVDQGTFTAPVNGAIQATVGGLLGVALTVQVNGEAIWTSPLNLLLPNQSPEIQVNAGDIVSATGVLGLGQTIEVVYFPNKI